MEVRRVKPPLVPNYDPGEMKVTVECFKAGDPKYETVNEDGTITRRGLTIAQVRNIIGGDEGTFQDVVTGRKIPLSLKQWVNEDPNNTYLLIRVSFKPKKDSEGKTITDRIDEALGDKIPPIS
jgi:hypothetical protein